MKSKLFSYPGMTGFLIAWSLGNSIAQDVPSKESITVEQVMQKLEDQLKSISTLELRWKQTLVSAPLPQMADRHAEKVRKLEASSPANEEEAKRREIGIRNEKTMEEHHRHARVSYSVWVLRYSDYGRYHGSKTTLDGDKKTLMTDYIGEAEGRHFIVMHSVQAIEPTTRNNVLFNTLSACPPLTIIHRLRMNGYPKEMPKAKTVSPSDSSVEVTFSLRDKSTITAKFTLPHFVCTHLVISSPSGKAMERMESSAPWKTVSHLPFLPAVWTLGDGPFQRTWEFLDVREVGKDAFKTFKMPTDYHMIEESGGIP